MQLAIDIGNSNVVIGVFRDETLLCQFRIGTNLKTTSDEYANTILSLLERNRVEIGSIRTVGICSVVPLLDPTFDELTRRYLRLGALFVGRELLVPLKVDLPNPEEVGADRLVNAYYVWRMYGKSAIVIDLGTATTFDVVTSDGIFLGGAIAPGVKTAGEALFRSASKLFEVPLLPPPQAIGKNTKEAIQSGLVLGYVGLIDFLVKRIKEELKEIPRVVATGGLAQPFRALSREVEEVKPDLTLCGLNMLLTELPRSA